MPEADDEGARFYAEQAQAAPVLQRLAPTHDWGMKKGSRSVFSPANRRTVMLAVDHGYFRVDNGARAHRSLPSCPWCRSASALFCHARDSCAVSFRRSSKNRW